MRSKERGLGLGLGLGSALLLSLGACAVEVEDSGLLDGELAASCSEESECPSEAYTISNIKIYFNDPGDYDVAKVNLSSQLEDSYAFSSNKTAQVAGKSLICRSDETFSTGWVRQRSFLLPAGHAMFVKEDNHAASSSGYGGSVVFSPPIPFIGGGGATYGVFCAHLAVDVQLGGFRIGRQILTNSKARFETLPNGITVVDCQYTGKIQASKKRPEDVIAASGDQYIRGYELGGQQLRSACSNVANGECPVFGDPETYNPGPCIIAETESCVSKYSGQLDPCEPLGEGPNTCENRCYADYLCPGNEVCYGLDPDPNAPPKLEGCCGPPIF